MFQIDFMKSFTFPINLALSFLEAYANKRIWSVTWITVLRDSIALVQVMCSYSSCPGHFSHPVSQKGYHITSPQGLGGGYRDALLSSHLTHHPPKRSVVSCCFQLLPHSRLSQLPSQGYALLWVASGEWQKTRTGTNTEPSPPIAGFFHDPECFPGLAKTWSCLLRLYGFHMPSPASYSLLHWGNSQQTFPVLISSQHLFPRDPNLSNIYSKCKGSFMVLLFIMMLIT